MTINQVIKKYSAIEIELLLAHLLSKPKEFLYLKPAYQLSANQLISLKKMIKRRLKGEPMAYILGYKDFCGLRFKVNRDVLIPRPETEELFERIMNNSPSPLFGQRGGKGGVHKVDRAIRILDLGTGSGCIAVSLAKQFSILRQAQDRFFNFKFSITASDVSKKALALARQNGRHHRVNVKFIKSDLLKNIKDDFDIIVANLPYVPNTDYKIIGKNLKFEPKVAIFAKEKGLFLINKLLHQISNLKPQPKLVYLEFDPRQKAGLAKLIKKILPNSEVKFYTDFRGFWRIVKITTSSLL